MNFNTFYGPIFLGILVSATIVFGGCIVDANESCVGEDDCFQDVPAECGRNPDNPDENTCGGWVNDIPSPDEFQVDRNISDAGVDGE